METRQDRSGIDAAAIDVSTATAIAAVSWVWSEFGSRCCLLSSMQDAVLIDIAMRIDRRLPIVFLDNGFHFRETLETLARVEAKYKIDVEVVRAATPKRLAVNPGECCDMKVALLDEALLGRDAWITGIRRHETDTRSDAPIIGVDRRGKVKVSPLAQWNDTDSAAYIASRDVIRNPLTLSGYPSVGCRPCTTAAQTSSRSGRWANTDRTECGLHL